jgi:Tfp pilus assembly protein PilF
MKNSILIILFLSFGNILHSQNKEDANIKISEGIKAHDKGDYKAAIKLYDKALEFDKDNILALYEKTLSLMSLQKYEEAITCCMKAIEVHPGHDDLKYVYVAYGNAYDALKKPEKSIDKYNEGIKFFPDFYQLYFNKGISLAGMQEFDDALACFHQSIMINPSHASSHNAIARISALKNKKVQSIMAYCRFLSIEPQGSRAIDNLNNLKNVFTNNVKETGKNAVTINVSSDMLKDTTANGKKKENNFSSTDLILTISASFNFDPKNKKKTDVELFITQMELMCSSLKESKKDNIGFYWEYYAPFFIELQEKKLVEPFAYIIFMSSEEANAEKWLKNHQDETSKLIDWLKTYQWKST